SSDLLFGPARRRGAPLEQRHLDLAASLQAIREETVLAISAWLRRASGQPQLVMAGGVALNCVMNSRVRDSGIFDAAWVQPAAGDAGTALGAALWIDGRLREQANAAGHREADPTTPLAPRRWRMSHAYLGPSYDDESIEALLRWAKLPYERLDDLAGTTARLLAQDRVIGWFQGPMEFGPRALGGRSILASPLGAQMQGRINELKDREDFRPVAPAVPEERLAD